MQGHEDAVVELLRASASLETPGMPFKPLHMVAAYSGDVGVAKRLVQARSFVDSRFRPRVFSFTWCLATGGSIAYRIGRRTSETRACYHAFGATPLIFCALRGYSAAAHCLLEAGAETDTRNCRGCRAADLAQDLLPMDASESRTELKYSPAGHGLFWSRGRSTFNDVSQDPSRATECGPGRSFQSLTPVVVQVARKADRQMHVE